MYRRDEPLSNLTRKLSAEYEGGTYFNITQYSISRALEEKAANARSEWIASGCDKMYFIRAVEIEKFQRDLSKQLTDDLAKSPITLSNVILR